MNDIIAQYLASGISIIPVRADKRPIIDWKKYQGVIATTEESKGWQMPIAAVCGAVSGGLTCIDFDDNGSCFSDWCNRVKDVNADILKSVYCQRTPSGGWHVVFRSAMKMENRKLAQRKADTVKVLIETRGEGGYFLVYPSEGYVAKRGELNELKEISAHDAETLILVAESFNEVGKEHETRKADITSKNGVSPFDDYDSRNNPVDLLVYHGWSVIGKRTDKVMLCRPGKDRSLSATWNHIPGRFYVFSTSTDFEAQHVYKASAVYAKLEHNGDFVAAAKKLYADGYGTRINQKKTVDYDTTASTVAVKISDFRDSVNAFYKGKRQRGYELGLEQFDKILRLEKGYLNVVTGIPSHGKSEFVDYLTVKLASKHDWKFVFFSPENYPLEIHFHKLAEKFHGVSMWGKDNTFVDEAIEFVDNHYRFINATEEELTLETILLSCLELKDTFKPSCLVIDPWNELEQAIKPQGMTDSEFTGVCLRKLRKFARKNNVCLIVVVHPTKMHKDHNASKYPVPSLYDVSGSANWYNKADNGIVVYRNFEPDNKTTDVYIKKVKFRTYGETGMVKFRYDVESGNYQEVSHNETMYDGTQD